MEVHSRQNSIGRLGSAHYGTGSLSSRMHMHNNAVRFVLPECGKQTSCVKTLESSGLLTPKGIAASADERHLFVCDTGHHKIKLAALPSRSVLADVERITDGVEMFAFAGNGKKGWRDGTALEASFNSPTGVCEYTDGTIVVADTGNHCIRQIRRTGTGKLIVKTIAGAYACNEVKSGGVQCRTGAAAGKRVSGYRDGVRSLFRSPSAVIAGPHGELLVADTMNNCIRGLLPSPDRNSPWKVTTICGQTRPGHADGNCEVALFDQPVSLCWGVDSNTFFVSDRGNACIRQVGRSYGDGLSYTWVRTIETGDVSRSVRNQSLYQCCHPLGMVYVPLWSTNGENVGSKLVVCDGGDNVIKILPLQELSHQALNAKELFETPQISDTRSVHSKYSQSESDLQSFESSPSSKTNRTESEGLSENQFVDDGETYSCESSRALQEALKVNAALQAENVRLRELLQCTFDEIELADKRFSENYKPQSDFNLKR